MKSFNKQVEELFTPLSNELFDAAHKVYCYRDTEDWHNDGLSEAEDIINDISRKLSRNFGTELREAISTLCKERVREARIDELEKWVGFLKVLQTLPNKAIVDVVDEWEKSERNRLKELEK